MLIAFFRKSCRLLDNVEKYGRARQATDENRIRGMRFACWITKATNIHSEYNAYCFSTAKIVTRTLLSITICVHFLSCTLQLLQKCVSFLHVANFNG